MLRLLNIRFVLKMLGYLLVLESFFMALTTAVAYFYQGYDAPYLLGCSIVTVFIGFLFIGIGYKADNNVTGKREGAITVSLTWLLFSFLGMMPYYVSGAIPSFTDAFFETMSGFTTTGASILTDVEALPKGLLFWRSITQWQGGMGMIVLTLAILPLLGGGAAHLLDAETTGVSHDKFLPRATSIAKRLWFLYVGLTSALFLLLWAGPMEFFDAVCHALTTMATGGYSTKQLSLEYYNSAYVDYVISAFMLVGGINFALLYFLFKGNWRRFVKDEELKVFLIVIAVAVVVVASGLFVAGWTSDVEAGFRTALFHVITLITSTGFCTTDYVLWGPFFWYTFILLTLFCGCAGSTSGGMKMIRAIILGKSTANEFRKYSHPKAVMVVRINRQAISSETINKVVAFVVIYVSLIMHSSLLFSAFGVDFVESFSAAVSCMSNTGPALGGLGPSGTYAELPDVVKWFCALLMMVGRLEIFTVLAVLTPGFWK